LEEKDVHLMGHHCCVHPLKMNKVHAAKHVTQFLSSEKISSFGICRNLQKFWRKQLAVSTIKMEEPTTFHFMVEKEEMVYFYSLHGVITKKTALFTYSYEKLKYHSQAKSATSISSLVHKIASCHKFFRIFKIKITANKQ
jgi:hypothetical protein